MLAGTIAYLIYIVISCKYIKEKNIRLANYVVILLVIASIVIVSASLYFPRGKGYVKEFIESGIVEENCSSVNGKIENFKEAVDYIKENDKDFYRISKKEVSYQNLSLMYGYNPIQLFLSLGNKNVYELSCDLDDNCYSSTQCVNGADRRTKYTTLLANKYYICDIKDARYIPYGYTLYHEIGETQIYINKNYLSIGIVYNSYITKEQFKKLSSLQKEDSLITAAMIEDTQKVNIENNKNIVVDTPLKLRYTVKDNRIDNNKINTTKKNEVIELTIDNIPVNNELYLSINNLKYISSDNKTDFKITAKLDGISNNEKLEDCISSAYYMDNPNFLMNLGVSKTEQNNKLKLTFNRKGTYTFDSLEILAVDMNKYEQKIDKLKTNVMENIEYGNNYIAGTVNADTNGILQITTSYSNGWKAYVDEKQVEVLKVNEAFIGIKLDKGNHNIRFEYETPYLKVGIVFSALGLIGYISLILIKRKKKNGIS